MHPSSTFKLAVGVALGLTLWTPDSQAATMNATTYAAVETSGTGFHFDDTVSTGQSSVSFPSPYDGFIVDQGIGVRVQSNEPNISFVDATGDGLDSPDITAGDIPTRVTEFVFLNPLDVSQEASVSAVGFHFGSVNGSPQIEFFDVAGNPIAIAPGQGVIPTSGNTSSKGWETSDGSSTIHLVRFTSITTDTWLVGSFTFNTSRTDMAFRNFQVTPAVPEPSSLGLLLLGLGVMLVRLRD